MKLKIENIGMIRHADIKLDGLTIIAGENDTGKSTVGKLIFSLVKAFTRYEQDLKESKSDRAFNLIEKAYFQLRKDYDFEKYEGVKDAFFPPSFFRELSKSENPIQVLERKIVLLEKIEAIDSIKIIESIKDIYLKEEDKKYIIKRALNKVLFSEFYSELTPKNCDIISEINISEGSNKILDVFLQDNNVKALDFHEELFFNDVTFIETPIYLQMLKLIGSAPTLFEMSDRDEQRFRMMGSSKVALHMKDLVVKLEEARYFSPKQATLFNNELEGLLENISFITRGEGFLFEKENSDLYFHKNKNTKFRVINTATGLKSFGIIQLLIQANVLNERSLLIIDEPEIHLHPKWQVKYAELIITLVKHNIPVLVTSHSPEIIHALTVFSEKFGIQDRTAYYLTESDGTVSDINDVTNEIHKIFIKLTEPLHDLLSGI